LAKLLLEPANLLVLDEPTNHLDMRSKDILKQALIHFDGTLIIVSHDRDFLDGMVDTVYEFRDKKAKQHLGGIAEFLQRKKMETLNQLNQAKKIESIDSSKPATENKMRFEDKKEWDKRLRKAQKQVEECEARIMDYETRIEDMDLKLSKPESITDGDFFKLYEDTKKLLAAELHKWRN
jgi:ATP-binding cassette subfamily F protein 3